jgi:hypothetical protein
MTTPSEEWAKRLFGRPQAETSQPPKPAGSSITMSEVLREALRQIQEQKAYEVGLIKEQQS